VPLPPRKPLSKPAGAPKPPIKAVQNKLPVKPGVSKPATGLPKPPAKPVAAAAPAAFCAKCQAPLDAGAQFCGECGAAVKHGIKPKRSLAEIRRNVERGKNVRQINEGRKMLLWVAVAMFVIGILAYVLAYSQIHQAESLRDHDALLNDAEIQGRVMHVVLVLVVVGNMLPAAIFFGLYMWAKSSPLPAIIAGLVTHVTFTIATVAFNPQVALAPMFWLIRIAILTALAKAIQSAMHEKKMREKERKREEARRRAEEAADEAGAGAEAAVE
jgi:hypothetical protein